MSGPCGNHHFGGRVAAEGKEKENQISIQGTLAVAETGEKEDITQASFLLPLLEALEYALMKQEHE